MQEKRTSPNEKLENYFEQLKTLELPEEIQKCFAAILELLNLHKTRFNLSVYCTVFTHLSELHNKKQGHALKVINQCIKQTYNLLKKQESIPFELPARILRTFPRLPVDWNNYKKFTKKILLHIDKQRERYTQIHQSSMIYTLGVYAKLSLDEEISTPLFIDDFIKKIPQTEENYAQMNFGLLGVLWQFCVYARAKFKNDFFSELLENIDNALSKKTHTPIQPTGTQRAIFTLLQEFLKEEFAQGLAMELVVGAYPLDIAILALNIDLEIDGEQHYRDEDRLIRIHCFRDEILREYNNWITLRIPLSEYAQLTTETHKLKYLEQKFASAGKKNIFKPVESPENPVKTNPKIASKKATPPTHTTPKPHKK